MAAKGVSTTSEPLESSDYYALIEHLERDGKYRWALFCVIACTMGLRVSDVKRLTWEDLLAGNLHFVDEIKTGKNRRVKINDSVRRKYLEYYDRMGRPPLEQLVFFSKRTGRAYTTQNINQHLRNFRQKYLLPVTHFSSHSLRKTLGKKIYEDHGRSEFGLMLVNKTFNHRDIQTSERYIGVATNTLESVYDSFQFK
ncbi:tyrosine-type recombinase/integrase [Alistipes sp. i18-0019-D1]|uniref:tyrosine-type recombinase/integrase n=1 Tax=Alistipes sp. i18-0019-D1 TaxID=3132707 RepID=UPI0036F2B5AA